MLTIRYIFISGGVLSGLGKGTTSASIALLLQSRGYKVCTVKCENYLNVDAGTINPIEHGDPFLCEDGTEADMDLGIYERFLDKNVGKEDFITMGQIYKTVIDKERAFGYKGEDVEAIPHVCDEIIRRIKDAGRKQGADIVTIELGGTAGEYQNVLYYESSRIMKLREGDSVIHVHVSYLPIPPHIGEPKTKPTQLSVKTLNSMGIQPDFIVARSEKMIDRRRLDRFALFCNMKKGDIIANPDVGNIYELPLIFLEQDFDKKILKKLGIPIKKINIAPWKKMIEKIKRSENGNPVTIAIVGKYFATGDYELGDSYAALIEALKHACWHQGAKLEIKRVNSEKQEKEIPEVLKGCNGIIVPIGWGPRGVNGMIKAINYARESNIPYLGLCYGMQLAAVEFAKNVIGLNAHSTEIVPNTEHPVIYGIPEEERYVTIKSKGVTMRLGAWDCILKEGTLSHRIYYKHKALKNKEKSLISERHRHRYEFNNKYRDVFEKNGMVISGVSPDNFFVEMIELPNHPFFLGTQSHPEYKSRPENPHPIFIEFVKACKRYK